MNNIKEIKTRGNAREVLELATKDADDLLGVVVIRIEKTHEVKIVYSDMSAYQFCYAKCLYDEMTSNMMRSKMTPPSVI